MKFSVSSGARRYDPHTCNIPVCDAPNWVFASIFSCACVRLRLVSRVGALSPAYPRKALLGGVCSIPPRRGGVSESEKMETVLGRRKASAIRFLLLTYLISTWALAAKTASKGHNAVALCLPTAPRNGCRSSSMRRSSAAASSTRRRHPAAMSLARAPLQRKPVSLLFERTRVATAEPRHGSRGAMGRLEAAASDSTGGPAAVSLPIIPAATDTPAGATARDAAEPASSSAAGPPFLSIKWGREQVQRLQRQACELPEDTAEEGRFLMMAALVGVITGTAGECGGVSLRSVCTCMESTINT